MTSEMVKREDVGLDVKVAESMVVRGDVSGLGPAQRVALYLSTCKDLGLNPRAQPFTFLRLNGKEVMYAGRGATDQLARIHNVTREMIDGPKVIDLAGTKLVYAVAKATLPGGRFETATATVPLVDPVNVLMKCETKAKRRATLALLGLAMLDETELDTIPASSMEPGPVIDVTQTSAARAAEAQRADEPQGSRAFNDFCEAIVGCETAASIRDAYAALLSGLRDEGATLTEYTDGDAGAFDLARRRLHALALYTSIAETTLLLGAGDEGRALASWLDAYTIALDSPEGETAPLPIAAAWWVQRRGEIPRGVGEAVFRVMQRSLATDPNDQAKVRLAGDALKAEIERISRTTPPDGTGGRRTSKSAKTSAETAESPATSTGSGTTALAAVPEWMGDETREKEYLSTKTDPVSLQNAVRKYGRFNARFRALAAARLQAVSHADHDGTRPEYITCVRDVERWSSEGPRQRAAARRVA